MDGLMTSAQRVETLVNLLKESAMESEYLHSPNDLDAGRA